RSQRSTSRSPRRASCPRERVIAVRHDLATATGPFARAASPADTKGPETRRTMARRRIVILVRVMSGLHAKAAHRVQTRSRSVAHGTKVRAQVTPLSAFEAGSAASRTVQ